MANDVCDAEKRMKMLPISQGLELDELPSESEPAPKSPFKRGLFIGLAIVILFWLGVLILGAALLMFH
jgi:hypothetical protein